MNEVMERPARDNTAAVEEFDVVIVGAGISGIGSAYHLQHQCPGKTFVMLEAQDGFGGTWRTHQYPGVRSDSDLYTFGYRFKPWEGPPIATGAEINKYLGAVIAENGLDRSIRYGTRVSHCEWSSADNKWTVETENADGQHSIFRCTFLWMCQGYYDHENPYLPEWPGVENFKGRLVHAQKWDKSLDYAGKNVVVVGSGATAATVIPAMADDAAHVTMLQRSPTYFFCYPNVCELADQLRAIEVDEPTIHRVVRQFYIANLETMERRCRDEPDVVIGELKAMMRQYAGENLEFDPHFEPSYRPWQQRLAFIPDGDLFRKIGEGKVSAVTDQIDHFTADGIQLKSGEHLAADVVIAATGFRLSVMGQIEFVVDGETVDWSEAATYRGMMFTGVPNMVWVFGYFRAAWTLRVDLVGDFVCRLLQRMDEQGAGKIEVVLPDAAHNAPLMPWIEDDNFNPNYLMRDMHKLPKRVGDLPEWRHSQNYWRERNDIPSIDLGGPEFQFG